jgi:hypothetical protein
LGLDEPTTNPLPLAPAPASTTVVAVEPARVSLASATRSAANPDFLEIAARALGEEIMVGSLAIQDPVLFNLAQVRSGLPTRHEGGDPRVLPPEGGDTAGSMNLASAATATGLALTAGTVWWALRAGGLLTSLVVSMPAWRHADLLAVLPDDEDDEDSWDPSDDEQAARDEEAVGQVLDPRFDGVAS